MSDDEKAARSRLGSWLSAEPGRTWDHWKSGGAQVVSLAHNVHCHDDCPDNVEGEGPTLAAAILDAIAKASE